MNYVGVASLLQFSVQVQKPNTVLNPDRQFSVKLSVSSALAISDGKLETRSIRSSPGYSTVVLKLPIILFMVLINQG